MKDITTISPKKATAILTRAFQAGVKVLLVGEPGVGKTAIIRQAAAAAGMRTLISHPAVSDPTDYKGLPAKVGKHAEFLPYGDLRALIEANEPTVAFFDDLGQAPHAVQAALMQPLHGGEINGQRISPHVRFCAATNDASHMAGVQSLLEPIKSRFHTILHIAPNVEEWVKWAAEHDLAPEVLAFVSFRGMEVLSKFAPTREMANCPSPRTLHYVSDLLKAGLDHFECLVGAAGSGFAHEFYAFLKTWKSMPDLAAILANPESHPLPADREPALSYAIAFGLSGRMTTATAGPALTYLIRMGQEWTFMAIRAALARDNAISGAPAIVKWAMDSRNQDLLIEAEDNN